MTAAVVVLAGCVALTLVGLIECRKRLRKATLDHGILRFKVEGIQARVRRLEDGW